MIRFFKKLFGFQLKEQEHSVHINDETTSTFTTISSANTDKLKVGDIITLGQPNEETGSYTAQWLKPKQNQYNLEVFDCRAFALNMMSTTSMEIASNFQRLRNSDGKEYIGKIPENGTKNQVNLSYDLNGEGIPDGILFKSVKMEEKWDIYKYNNSLLFIRSWTGVLAYISDYTPTDKGFKIDHIIMDKNNIVKTDPFFEFNVVNFLIISHVLGNIVPHPIPKEINRNNFEDIKRFSFSLFGNRGLFATFDNYS